MNATVLVILVLVGAVVVGVGMLWFLGWCFRAAVDSDGHIGAGFWVLVTVVVILAYGWVLSQLLAAALST